MIGDGLTQGTKVIGHALHLAIVIANAQVTLFEDAEPGIELQNTRLAVAEELSLECKPHLMSGLPRFTNDLVEFGGEGVEDPCHHDAVQSSPIDGWIGGVGEDVVIQGVSMKYEKHEVTLPLIVGRRGFQNDRDHRSYVLDAGNLCVQVHGEGGIGVGAGVNRAIIIIVLGHGDPLGSGELLFQVTSEGLLLLPSVGDDVLTRSGLLQDLTCGSHDGDESLLLSVCDCGNDLSHGRGIILLPLGSGSGLLLFDGEVRVVARHGRQDGGN
jgi:hypothetical protein